MHLSKISDVIQIKKSENKTEISHTQPPLNTNHQIKKENEKGMIKSGFKMVSIFSKINVQNEK